MKKQLFKTFAAGFTAVAISANAQTWTPIFYPGAPTETDTIASGSASRVNGISFLDDNNGIVQVSQSYHTTTNGGATWSDIKVTNDWLDGTGVPFYASSSNILIGVQNRIFRSTDGGATNAEVQSINITISDMDFSGNFGVATGQSCGVAYTTDGGSNWTRITNPTVCGDLSAMRTVEVVNATTAFIGGNNNTFYKTTNAGTTWTPIAGISNVNSISFAGENNGYLISDEGLFKTTDGGTSWTAITNSSLSGIELDNFQSAVYAVNGNTIYVLYSPSNTNTGKVLVSEDGGANFTEDFSYTMGTGSISRSWIKGAGNSVYFVSRDNKVYKKSLSNPSGIRETEANRISVYPNPAVSHIQFSETVNVQLYTIAGQLAAAKENTTTLDISDLSTGVYSLVLTDKKGELLQRNKIVKQ